MDPIKVQIFRPLTDCMKISQISYVIFQATSQFSFNFCITFQCHDTSFLWNFLIETLYGLDKGAHQCTIFQNFGCSKEIYPIHHAIFETTRLESIQSLHHCSVSWKITPLYFLAKTLYTLDKNSPSNWNFWTFEWLGKNSPNF